jgi:hypothetical protein
MSNLVDELVKAVAKKAKIDETIATIAVNTALTTLKKKLPSNVANILDSFLDGKGGSVDADLLSSLAGKFLGGGSSSSKSKKK